MPTPLEELRGQILVAPYPDMEPHVRRGGFILIDTKLDLAEIALQMEANDEASMRALIESSLITKPDASILDEWRRDKRFFRFLIVQPWVVGQYYEPVPAAEPKDFN
jgi:hypothetical protein